MSSDSDDIDEDELLQIALREQAQRDLSYNKGHPSKPVANFVQPPPSPQPQFFKEKNHQQPLTKKAARSAVAQRNPSSMSSHRRRVAQDDRDSEVEMLSISSGDEGSPSRRQGVAGKSRVGTARREEGSSDEGSEPNCWKRVDEDELHRSVRSLREARVVKTSAVLGGKGVNNMLSSPRGMEFVDPLGLGLIDIKSIRLITDGYESSSSRSERDYPDSSLREKLMYFSEGFNARLFLSRLHQDTSAVDLEAGAVALKADLQGRTRQKKQLVKENFDCFVSCKTTIDDIESKLRRIEEDPEGAGTSHLYNSIQAVSSLAKRAFQPLFERQAQAEKIRSVQGMLQRFRTLFNLPSTIRESISKGEYDLAVREYRKAKSIVLPSHVGILKRVQEEVEKVMHEFKGMLYKSMENPQVDLTTLENTVRLLLELEPDSDPVWHYLKIQNQRIPGLLERCTFDHEMQMEMLHSEMRERVMSEARWGQLLQDLSFSSDASHYHSLQNDKLMVDWEHVELSGEEVDALRGRYIRRLTAVLTHHLPNFWKVALSVFSGKFTRSVPAESNTNTTANKSDEKMVDGSYCSHSLDEVAGMIRSTISAYESKVRNAFHDLEESNILRPYMSDVITEISNACHAFESKASTPPVAVTALRALHLEISKVYMLRLCSWMRASLEEVSKEESWIPVSTLERNKSPYTISVLPLEFRSVIVAAMDQINLMIRPLRSEVVKSVDMLVVFQELQESVRLSFLNCFLDFAGHMECLGSELAQRGSGKVSMQLQNGFIDDSKERLPGSVVDSHRQLLIVLSNIGYCKDELCGELYRKYQHVWLQSRVKDEEDSDLHDLVMSFSGLEEKVLDHYTFMKSNLIRTAATSYLLESGFQWGGGTPAVKGVRDAAVELLHSLVAVHAEVFAGAKPLLDRTLGILVEALVDTFLSLFNENRNKELNSLDPNGFCQMMLELDYFETILNPYFTSDASESLKSLQGVLLEKATENVMECGENPGHQRKATRGSEDNLTDQQGMCVSPDDLIALAHQCSSELLQAELERTLVNTACFVESIVLDAVVPEPAKAAYSSFGSSMSSSPTKGQRTGRDAHRHR